MPRINSAKYKDEIIDAFEVDDNYESFTLDTFKCPECSVKIAFNRGINHKDPHFKNWPKINHKHNCEIQRISESTKNKESDNVQVVISTILPRADRIRNLTSIKKLRQARKRYFGERSRRFLNSLISLTRFEIENLEIRTEDKRTVKVLDLIMRQDSIIDKLDKRAESFVCILKGFTTKSIKVGKCVKIPMTYGGTYGNSNKFDLFIPASHFEKNKNKIDNICNKLIYCYGIPEKNKYGFKIDLYSITHQIALLEK